jgi:hypothetical protein
LLKGWLDHVNSTSGRWSTGASQSSRSVEFDQLASDTMSMVPLP